MRFFEHFYLAFKLFELFLEQDGVSGLGHILVDNYVALLVEIGLLFFMIFELDSIAVDLDEETVNRALA